MHVSTDYVFSGRENGGVAQDEATIPGPISAYGSVSYTHLAYETLTTGSGSQPPVPCATAVPMLCTGEAGAFNPVLLDCLREIENEIDEAMRRRPETL